MNIQDLEVEASIRNERICLNRYSPKKDTNFVITEKANEYKLYALCKSNGSVTVRYYKSGSYSFLQREVERMIRGRKFKKVIDRDVDKAAYFIIGEGLAYAKRVLQTTGNPKLADAVYKRAVDCAIKR